MTGVVHISWWQLALAFGFMLLAGAASVALQLGVAKRLLIATLRTYAQLLLLGLVLGWVFDVQNPWVVLLIVSLMVSVAAMTVGRRAPDAPRGVSRIALFALTSVGAFVTFTVTGLIVGVDPWYSPRYVIPIAGMVLGNSMNGMALAFERTFSDLDARSDEILTLTALGATPWEAAAPSVRKALRAGMIPGINTLSAAGIVFIPGMMSGQVLAGSDPMVAAPYQIVVMLMIAASDILGSSLALLIAYRRRFSDEGVFLARAHRV